MTFSTRMEDIETKLKSLEKENRETQNNNAALYNDLMKSRERE